MPQAQMKLNERTTKVLLSKIFSEQNGTPIRPDGIKLDGNHRAKTLSVSGIIAETTVTYQQDELAKVIADWVEKQHSGTAKIAVNFTAGAGDEGLGRFEYSTYPGFSNITIEAPQETLSGIAKMLSEKQPSGINAKTELNSV